MMANWLAALLVEKSAAMMAAWWAVVLAADWAPRSVAVMVGKWEAR
jgi:hypothetical protein